MYVNSHQECDVRQHQAKIAELKQTLAQARVALDTKPAEAARILAETNTKATSLETKLLQVEWSYLKLFFVDILGNLWKRLGSFY